MRAVMLALVLIAACGDNARPVIEEDAGVLDPLDAAAPDAAPEALRPCLDTPSLRPPNGQLPCDLLPPGFAP